MSTSKNKEKQNQMKIETTKEAQFKKIIYALSAIIPLVVVLLFRVDLGAGINTDFLPPIYATTNGLTAILLIIALWAIKQKNIALHERIIKICIGLSVLFLVLYVVRHMTSSETVFGDTDGDGILSDIERGALGSTRYIYYFILVTHIALSVVVIPLVLLAYMRGMLRQIEKHKKMVRFAFPIWLYVAVTGVVVYLMIAPYYSV